MVFPQELLISYVDSLELEIWDAGAVETSIAGSTAIAFPKSLNPKFKGDIESSTLFAQLAANAKYDHTKETTEWYQYYGDVLANVGWGVRNFNLTEVTNAGNYLSVDNLLFALANVALTPAELRLFKSMLYALADPVDTIRSNDLTRHSASGNKANVQLGIAGESSGSAALKIGGYTYVIDTKIADVLFTKFGSQTVQFFYSSQTMVLNDAVYSAVREKINEILKRNLAEAGSTAALKKDAVA